MILPWYARLALRVIAALALVILYGPLLLTIFLSFFDVGRDGVHDRHGLLPARGGGHRGSPVGVLLQVPR